MELPPMEELLGPTGLLASRFPAFEHRRQQVELAEEVRKTFLGAAGEVLAAEAPPGIGKTFAVLVPAMLWAKENGKRILFLTAGIPLQEQLIFKDLPLLNRVLGLSLPFGLLKGKGNYACLLRAEEGSEEGFLSFGDRGTASVLISEWIRKTFSGDLSELPLPPGSPAVARIAASSRSCAGYRCPFRERCFVQKAIREAQGWSVTVANYHLFFSYLLGLGKPFPVPYDILVCDEAHRLAEAARSSMGLSVSFEDILRVLRGRSLSLLSSIAGGRGGASPEELAGEVRKEAAVFFDLLDMKYSRGRESLAGRNEEIHHQQEVLSSRILELSDLAAPFLEEENCGEEMAGLSMLTEELRRIRLSLAWCSGVEQYPSWAYWKEGRALFSAPVAPFEELPECIFSSSPEKTIFLSATLTIGGKWTFWKRETGILPTRTFIGDSPFDLASQMEILVVDTGLGVQDPRYDPTVSRVIEKLVDSNGGRTLVLVSSHRLLGRVAELMRSKPREYSVLVQGEYPRSELLRMFREDLTSVLVGSASFREGVDVPGEGLSQVIIDRIPFPHPDDPIVRARNALEGRNAFSGATLPEAKMLLRQAAGRLIRNRTDRGRVAILDGRVLDREDWNIPASLPKVRYRRLVVTASVAGVESV